MAPQCDSGSESEVEMPGKYATLWEQVKDNLVELYETAADKTDELAKVGARKIDKISINRHLEKAFTELGGIVYHMHTEQRLGEVGDDAEVRKLLSRLAELEKDLERKNSEIESIREEKRKRAEKKPEPSGDTPES